MIRRRPRGEPVHPTRAEIRSGWRFLAALPGRGWRLVAHLWRSSRATTLLVLVATGAVALTLALLSLLRHRANIGRLLRGQENPV